MVRTSTVKLWLLEFLNKCCTSWCELSDCVTFASIVDLQAECENTVIEITHMSLSHILCICFVFFAENVFVVCCIHCTCLVQDDYLLCE